MQPLIFICLFVFFTNNWCRASETVQCGDPNTFPYCYCCDRDGEFIPVVPGSRYLKYWDSINNKDTMTCACGLAEVDGENVRCTRNGDFEPIQCEAGVCHCVDPQTGTKHGSYSDSVENLEQMTCKCAQAEFEKGTTEACTANGNFDDVKCDDTQCYCIDLDNGEVIQDEAGNPKYSDDVSNQHIMNCACAQDVWQNPHKTTMYTQYCKANGNYDTIMCKPEDDVNPSFCFCSDPEGTPFKYGETETSFKYSYWAPEKENLDCRCALAHWYHVDSGAEGHLYEEECDKMGGFRPMQCHDGTCFCVDEEGHAIAGEDGQPLYTMDQTDFDALGSNQQPKCKCARANKATGASDKCTHFGDKLVACNDYTSGNSKCYCIRPDDPARAWIGHSNTALYSSTGPTAEKPFGMDCECAAAKYMEAGEPETLSRDQACQADGNWAATGNTGS